MTPRDQRSDEPSVFDALAGALGGFVREFRKGLGEPDATAEQALATAQAEADALQKAVTGLTQAVTQSQQEAAQKQQAMLDMLARIAERQEQIDQRVAALEAAGKPEEAARWRALLKRLGQIAALLVGPTAVAAALRDALVENELYPALRDRLLGLLAQGETVLEAAAIPPAPTPAAPAPTPAPAEVRTPAPEEIEAARQGEVWPEEGPIRFDWVTIPAGEFLMGSDPRVDRDAWDDELPQHRVWLPAYQIARAPVTNRQFVAFLTATGYQTDRERAGSDYVCSWQRPVAVRRTRFDTHLGFR